MIIKRFSTTPPPPQQEQKDSALTKAGKGAAIAGAAGALGLAGTSATLNNVAQNIAQKAADKFNKTAVTPPPLGRGQVTIVREAPWASVEKGTFTHKLNMHAIEAVKNNKQYNTAMNWRRRAAKGSLVAGAIGLAGLGAYAYGKHKDKQQKSFSDSSSALDNEYLATIERGRGVLKSRARGRKNSKKILGTGLGATAGVFAGGLMGKGSAAGMAVGGALGGAVGHLLSKGSADKKYNEAVKQIDANADAEREQYLGMSKEDKKEMRDRRYQRMQMALQRQNNSLQRQQLHNQRMIKYQQRRGLGGL